METRTIGRFPGYGFREDGVILGKNGEPLRPWPAGDYQKVALSVGGARREVYVHQAICEAFRGPRPPGLIAMHLDEDHANCRADNLAWGTRSENVRRSLAHRGRVGRRERDAQIGALAAAGLGQVAIARAIGCSQSTVSTTLRRHRESQR